MEFFKLQASGNDFVAMEWDKLLRLGKPEEVARRISRRHLSVGADGLISPVPDDDYPFRFLYINYMGKEVPFCGHAGRALPYFARIIGMVHGNEIQYISPIGPRKAIILQEDNWKALVGMDMGPFDIVPLENGQVVNVGVQHFVISTSDIDLFPLKEKALQFFEKHPGIHFNIFEEIERGRIRVRTWEYGYPEEPLSCATGSLAAAIAYSRISGIKEVEVVPRSGESLFVEIKNGTAFFSGWVKAVFRGELLEF